MPFDRVDVDSSYLPLLNWVKSSPRRGSQPPMYTMMLRTSGAD